jgi:predicted nucleic acid-binding protein
VLDSSVTLSWYFEDAVNEVSEEVFDQVANTGAVVPALWRYEVANGLQLAVRHGRISSGYRDESLSDLAQLSVEIDQECERHAWSAGMMLAERHGLTVYDATYLEVAQRRRLGLATFDRALIRAANSEGVPVFGSMKS